MAGLSLAQLRFDAGLTPEELGDLCGISGRQVRRIEEGTVPTPRIAKKLADHFKLKPSDLWPVEPIPATTSGGASA
jgi:transcriptional regulator with XRE-family HTH domain